MMICGGPSQYRYRTAIQLLSPTAGAVVLLLRLVMAAARHETSPHAECGGSGIFQTLQTRRQTRRQGMVAVDWFQINPYWSARLRTAARGREGFAEGICGGRCRPPQGTVVVCYAIGAIMAHSKMDFRIPEQQVQEGRHDR